VTLWAVTAIGLVAAAGVAFGKPVVSLPSTSLRTRLRPLRETSVLGMLATACRRRSSAPTQRNFAAPESQGGPRRHDQRSGAKPDAPERVAELVTTP
jgi:DHA1 family inner membrane transport protein